MSRSVALAVQESWFVPDVDANREDPSPFRVLLRPMTATQKRTYQMGNLDGGGSYVERTYRVHQEVFAEHVSAVEGYELRVGDVVLAPKSGADLWAAILAGPASELRIIDQVIEAIEKQSALGGAVQKK